MVGLAEKYFDWDYAVIQRKLNCDFLLTQRLSLDEGDKQCSKRNYNGTSVFVQSSLRPPN